MTLPVNNNGDETRTAPSDEREHSGSASVVSSSQVQAADDSKKPPKEKEKGDDVMSSLTSEYPVACKASAGNPYLKAYQDWVEHTDFDAVQRHKELTPLGGSRRAHQFEFQTADYEECEPGEYPADRRPTAENPVMYPRSEALDQLIEELSETKIVYYDLWPVEYIFDEEPGDLGELGGIVWMLQAVSNILPEKGEETSETIYLRLSSRDIYAWIRQKEHALLIQLNVTTERRVRELIESII